MPESVTLSVHQWLTHPGASVLSAVLLILDVVLPTDE